jgi:hypothetical protein
MKSYIVKWVIDIDATSPEDAAEQALEIMRDEASIATVFSVDDGESTIVTDITVTDDGYDHRRVSSKDNRESAVQIDLYGGLWIKLSSSYGTGVINSNLHDADESEAEKAAIDAIESLALSLFLGGVDVNSEVFKTALLTSLDAIANH